MSAVVRPSVDWHANEVRPRLLFLSHVLPFPPDEGARIRTWHLLRALADAFDITVVCLYRASEHAEADVARARNALEGRADLQAFLVPQSTSRIRLMIDHLRSLITRRAHTWYSYETGACKRAITTLMASGTFDLVHVDSMDLCAYLPLLAGQPVVCGHHNVESDLLQRRAQAERSAARRAYLAFQAELLEEVERSWAPRAALNLVVSDVDARTLAHIAPGARTLLVPNGVDTRRVRPTAGGRHVLFMGGHGWAPNRDAMLHFCEDILPHIRRRHADVQVTWLGRVPDSVRREYGARYGVNVTGYVDDIRPWLSAACHVVPLRTGGGTRLKILDAWAAAQAVVSTSVGCEGLDARDGYNIMVRDDPRAFADAVCRMIEDPSVRADIGAAARRTAEERYDWTAIGEGLARSYTDLVRAAAAPSRRKDH